MSKKEEHIDLNALRVRFMEGATAELESLTNIDELRAYYSKKEYLLLHINFDEFFISHIENVLKSINILTRKLLYREDSSFKSDLDKEYIVTKIIEAECQYRDLPEEGYYGEYFNAWTKALKEESKEELNAIIDNRKGLFENKYYEIIRPFGDELKNREKATLEWLSFSGSNEIREELLSRDFSIDKKVRNLLFDLRNNQYSNNENKFNNTIKQLKELLITDDGKIFSIVVWNLINLYHSAKEDYGVKLFIDSLPASTLGDIDYSCGEQEETYSMIPSRETTERLEQYLIENYRNCEIYEVKERIIQLLGLLCSKNVRTYGFLNRLLLYPEYVSEAVIEALKNSKPTYEVKNNLKTKYGDIYSITKERRELLNDMFGIR